MARSPDGQSCTLSPPSANLPNCLKFQCPRFVFNNKKHRPLSPIWPWSEHSSDMSLLCATLVSGEGCWALQKANQAPATRVQGDPGRTAQDTRGNRRANWPALVACSGQPNPPTLGPFLSSPDSVRRILRALTQRNGNPPHTHTLFLTEASSLPVCKALKQFSGQFECPGQRDPGLNPQLQCLSNSVNQAETSFTPQGLCQPLMTIQSLSPRLCHQESFSQPLLCLLFPI